MKVKIFILIILIQAVVNPRAVTAQSGGRARETAPLELKGSTEQRIGQNLRAENLGINQIANDVILARLIQEKILVELTNGDNYFIERGTETKPWKIIQRVKGKRTVINCAPKPNRVFTYPWVKEFLDKLATDHSLEFKKKKFKITSGTRSLEEHKLMRTKGSCYYTPNAAQAAGPLEESLHVRGIAIDISRKGMKSSEIRWMRKRLIADKINGIEFEIDPIEENICYHIVVFPKAKQSAKNADFSC